VDVLEWPHASFNPKPEAMAGSGMDCPRLTRPTKL